MPMKRALIAFLLVTSAVSGAHARTWYIKPDHSGDAPTIQAGIDSATVADTVLVAPGAYTWTNQGTGSEYGMIYIKRDQNGFVLRSEAGPQATFLDAEYKGRVLFIAGWNYITVEGFTIRRGMAPSFGDFTGAGIATHLSFDHVRNCIFRDNIAEHGGGLWCGGVSAMQIEDCEFFNNQATSGAAIYLINSGSGSPTIRNCTFHRNRASGGGGAIYAVSNGFHLENCVIAINSAEAQGGAIYGRGIYATSVTSCTICENTAPEGSAIYLTGTPVFALDRTIVSFGSSAPFAAAFSSVLTVSCTDVYGNHGADGLPSFAVDSGGNFSLDPRFCGPQGSENYSVGSASPCASGNHPSGNACDLIGAFGVGCDGPVKVETMSWGRVKSLYR
jgi:predicted outer membrane repeat protein